MKKVKRWEFVIRGAISFNSLLMKTISFTCCKERNYLTEKETELMNEYLSKE